MRVDQFMQFDHYIQSCMVLMIPFEIVDLSLDSITFFRITIKAERPWKRWSSLLAKRLLFTLVSFSRLVSCRRICISCFMDHAVRLTYSFSRFVFYFFESTIVFIPAGWVFFCVGVYISYKDSAWFPGIRQASRVWLWIATSQFQIFFSWVKELHLVGKPWTFCNSFVPLLESFMKSIIDNNNHFCFFYLNMHIWVTCSLLSFQFNQYDQFQVSC